MTGAEPTATVTRLTADAARHVPGVRARPGVRVQVAAGRATVDLTLVTGYGQSVPAIGAAVRRAVADRVAAETGVTVLRVDVTVTAIADDTGADTGADVAVEPPAVGCGRSTDRPAPRVTGDHRSGG